MKHTSLQHEKAGGSQKAAYRSGTEQGSAETIRGYWLPNNGIAASPFAISRNRAAYLIKACRSRRKDNVLRTAIAFRLLDCGLVILRKGAAK